MRHLITGGAGFIGSALASRLVFDGHEVVVFDRFSRGKESRIPQDAQIVRGDIRDDWAVERMIKIAKPNAIWHLAYVQGTQTFYSNPKDVISVALRGIMNVLDACDGQDLFLVSSSEAYQVPPPDMFPTDETVPLSVPDVTNPRYSYGGGKIASEIATLAYADVLQRAVIVRPHNIYGPDMGHEHVIPEFAMRMRDLPEDERAFPIQGTGEETRSFCHVNDCIDALGALFADAQTGVYHLGNPAEEYTIASLAHLVAKHFGRDIEIVPGKLPKGSPTRRLPDITKLAALGFEPKVSLPQGLGPTCEWYATETKEQAA